MLFYKIEGVSPTTEAEEGRRASRAVAGVVAAKSAEFNEKHGRTIFCFVSNLADEAVTVGVIAQRAEDVDKMVEAYLAHIDCPLTDRVQTEVTLGGLQQLLRNADRQRFIHDDDEVLEKYGLDKIDGRRNCDLTFGENIIDIGGRDDVFARAERYLFRETLLPELQRIYAGSAVAKPCGHPVHYMLQTDDRDTRREVYKTVLQALYANGRLRSRRYSFLDFTPGETFSVAAYDMLYRVAAGGAVVVRYAEEGGFGGNERDTVERLCEVAKRHRNQVLTILCLPRECKQTKALFYEHLGTVAVVELQEDFVSGEQAVAFLKTLAKEARIRTDKHLLAQLEEERAYLAPELRTLFDEWYNRKLRTTVYPQYKELQVADRAAVKAAPKGCAYDELQDMIGLKEAKAVIQKALNYYKMQRLYEEKGVKRDAPAMHMVFSGNPGTAKTTAARLFARIMRDNGLLSKGQLVEVGRGDLVGKYVGWTAKTVQAKFKAASGGVLFIDEAYSLVDDRNGSFGDEAINTIVQEMENHREDVVVIFAGYPDKMEGFLQKNPGLRSRIAFHVPFEDYNAEELCAIAALMLRQKGIALEETAMEKLGTIFETARRQSDFGNGRYVRNVLEQAKMNQASRLLGYDFDAITTEEVTTIKAVDIVVPAVKVEEKRTIGFAC